MNMPTLTVADMRAQGYTREHAEQWLAAQAAPRTIPPPPPTDPPAMPSNAEVRAWAAQAGVPCPTRGRLPAVVLARWAEAH